MHNKEFNAAGINNYTFIENKSVFCLQKPFEFFFVSEKYFKEKKGSKNVQRKMKRFHGADILRT